MNILHSYLNHFSLKLFVLLVLLLNCKSCSDTSTDSSRKPEKVNASIKTPSKDLNETRISLQDLNKTFAPDGKRQVSAIPLLPYPVELNLTSPHD